MPSDLSADHERYMRECLREAAAAERAGEVPVGAVVVSGGVIVGRGRNKPITTHDPTAHAEVVALREAAATAGNYRLVDADLYVTVEPCLMCVGAVGGLFDVTRHAAFNHRFAVQGGVCESEARALLQRFFRARRARDPESAPRA